MVNPARLDFVFVPGDDICETITVEDDDTGNSFDMTGFTGTLTVRETPSSPTTLASLTEGFGLTFGDGTIDVDTTAASGGPVDTSGWNVYEVLHWSLKATDTVNCKDTFLYGRFIIEEVA